MTVKVPLKNALVGVRTTKARKEMWREVAAREGMRLSEWMRKIADQKVAETNRAGR